MGNILVYLTSQLRSAAVHRDDGREDSRTSTQSPSKRARSSAAVTIDSDYEGGPDAGDCLQ